MIGVITIPGAVYVIWWIMLIVSVLVVLPLVVWLLSRVLTAARNIKGYTATTLEAGVGIVQNTASVAALQETIAIATEILQVAQSIEERTAVIQQVLTERAGGHPEGTRAGVPGGGTATLEAPDRSPSDEVGS